VAQPVYATPEEYAAWLYPDDEAPVPPAGATRALRAASGRIDELLLTAHYDTDTDGKPTDADVAEALMEATCAQADYQKGIGDANSTGAPQQWASVGIGSARLSRGQAAGGGTAGASKYSSEAAAILQRAGLIPAEPWAR
jgi:hypothetical protein